MCSIYRVIEIEIEDSLAIVDLASNLISISFFFAEKPSGVCGGVRVPNFRFIIDGWVVGERHNLNQEHHLAHTATPILASLLITRQKHTRERQKKSKIWHEISLRCLSLNGQNCNFMFSDRIVELLLFIGYSYFTAE